MYIDLNALRNADYTVEVNNDIIHIIPEGTMYLDGLSKDLRGASFSSDYDREACLEKAAELIQNEQIKSVLFGSR